MQPVFDVTSAIAVLNQTLEFAYPTLTIVGEVSEFRISKGKWLYFDIKDDESKLKCFGTVFSMKMPLEDGMKIELVAQPRLHNLYGFSLNVVAVKPVGEGSIKKAKDALFARLDKEGLFAPERKRPIPYPPERIALVTSTQSAAYADFIKIISARWPIVDIEVFDVQVQGALAEEEIVQAIASVNFDPEPADVMVIIRGGGSADDLSAFSLETVTRAVASSRIPTLVAIGHEVDLSLAELASDMRASTPSNAAELLVPDKQVTKQRLDAIRAELHRTTQYIIDSEIERFLSIKNQLKESVQVQIDKQLRELEHIRRQLRSYHPDQVLQRGFALVRIDGMLIRKSTGLHKNDAIEITFIDGTVQAKVEQIESKE